jgi:2-oxoglutarate dehydrogenase E2 component (dihydrolipoamide succinyltransferase)
MPTEVVMPQLGEGVVEGLISQWLKKEGDTVEEYEPLLEVASDKVDTEIPSPAGGTILKLLVEEGDTVEVGTVIAMIGEVGEEVADDPQPEPAAVTAPPTAAAPVGNGSRTNGAVEPGGRGGDRISPVVARIASEHNVNLNEVPGTGRYGRVTKKDILAYVEGRQAESAPAAVATPTQPATQPTPEPKVAAPVHVAQDLSDHTHKAPPAAGRPGEVVKLSRRRKLIADHMVESKLKTAPHVTTVFEADMSAVVAHRKAHKPEFAQRGINLTYTAYFIAAAAQALATHPMVNSRFTDEGIYLDPNINIGMAVAVDEGLIVPVVKHVDELSLAGIARRVNDLAKRGRSGDLKADEIRGGTFTITNHGVSGSLFATPIINQPQTGILGVGAMVKRVVVLDDDTMGIRPMIYLTLTFDHRVLDGAGADFFVAEIKSILENWQ